MSGPQSLVDEVEDDEVEDDDNADSRFFVVEGENKRPTPFPTSSTPSMMPSNTMLLLELGWEWEFALELGECIRATPLLLITRVSHSRLTDPRLK